MAFSLRFDRWYGAGLLAALMAGGLLLSGCQQTGRPAPSGSAVTGAGKAADQEESSSAAAIRRFHSQLRQGPSGR